VFTLVVGIGLASVGIRQFFDRHAEAKRLMENWPWGWGKPPTLKYAERFVLLGAAVTFGGGVFVLWNYFRE
jgi:hypothetical protein